MYVVLAVTGTGVPKWTSCQPWVDSPVNVAVASSWPEAFHRVPVWVPVLPAPL